MAVPQYSVSTALAYKKDDVVVEALIGDYIEVSKNHSKKVYQKTQLIEGHEDVKVFLYYWDLRDGADISGWWFGDRVGGTQVWAHSDNHGSFPPRTGWKIPWNADRPEPGVLLCEPFQGGAAWGQHAESSQISPIRSAQQKGKRTNQAIMPNNVGDAKSSAKGHSKGWEELRNKGRDDSQNGRQSWRNRDDSRGKGRDESHSGRASWNDMLREKLKKKFVPANTLERDAHNLLEKARGLSGRSVKATVNYVREQVIKQIAKLDAVLQNQKAEIDQSRLQEFHADLTRQLQRIESNFVDKDGEDVAPIEALSTSEAPSVRIRPVRPVRRTVQEPDPEAEADEEPEEPAPEKTEAEHMADFEEGLREAQESTMAAEDNVEAVCIMGQPMISNPPEDLGDDTTRLLADIESAYTDALTIVEDARMVINSKLKASRTYPEELRKRAQGEFKSLSEKVSEAQGKLNPFRNFKDGFQARMEARKELAEIEKKVAHAELLVEKAVMMSTSAEHQKMTDDEVKYTEELVEPAQSELMNVAKLIDQKTPGATDAVREELNRMKQSLTSLGKKLGGVRTLLKLQRESWALDKLLKEAHDKVEKAEAAIQKCDEAEQPIVNGVQGLEEKQALKALSESESAAVLAGKMVEQTMGFIRTKIAEAKGYSKDINKPVIEELLNLQERAVDAGKRVTAFKNDTMERKISLVMSEVLEAVKAVEEKGREFKDAARFFEFEATPCEEWALLEVEDAREKYVKLETEVLSMLMDARKALLAKQKDAKGEDLAKGFVNMNSRLNIVQHEVTKAKKAKATCDLLVQGKKLVEEQDTKLREAEVAVEKADNMAKGEEFSDEAVKEIDVLMNSANADFKSCQVAVQGSINASPSTTKKEMQKLLERCKIGFSKVEKVRAATKGQRENMMVSEYLKACEEMVVKVEDAMSKAHDAELPLMAGEGVLDLQETLDSLKAADDHIKGVDAAIMEARALLAAKNMEMKMFKTEKATTALAQFITFTERINAQALKLGQLRKDTESRRITAKVEEAGGKITALEGSIQELNKKLDALNGEEPEHELWESLLVLEKEVNTQATEARAVLVAGGKDRSQAERFEVINKLHSRLNAANTELVKVRKTTQIFELKFKGRLILEEARKGLTELEAGLKTLTDFCNPLLEEGGESFLVESRLSFILNVLNNYMEERSFGQKELFADILGGKEGNITKEVFLAFLKQLPEKTRRDDCELPEARQVTLFERMDRDSDGEINIEDFTATFRKRYICVHGIAMTDVFDIQTSKAITKLEAGDVLHAIGLPKKDTPEGVPRILCRVPSKDKEGWVTMLGNGGTVYMEELSEYREFCEAFSKKLEEAQRSTAKALLEMNTKSKELAAIGSSNTVVEMKTELSKMLEQATAATAQINGFQKRFSEARMNFVKKEEAEANAHVEARDRKQAEAIIEVCTAAIEALENKVQKLKAAAEPLISVTGDQLLAFAKPLSLEEHLKELMAGDGGSIAETVSVLHKENEKVTKVFNGPLLKVRQQMITWLKRASAADNQQKKVFEAVANACAAIAETRLADAVTALRNHMREAKIAPEDLWSKLANAGEERISEAAFCEYLTKLESVKFDFEQAQLATRKIETGGVGRRTFQGLLQSYYIVVKEIAITESFDVVVKEKPLRRALLEEVFEVLEGPCSEEKTGLQRIRGRSMNDGLVGWVTVQGNGHGTEFLAEVEKPYFVCVSELPMEAAFNSGSELLRTLKVEEVLEFIEGPRTETFPSGSRMRCKALADGKHGWVTVKDRYSTEFVARTEKHYICTSSVAMTGSFDVNANDVKAVRKLAVDEVFTVLEGPMEDESSGITRVKARTANDGEEGWITIKGNAGTVYAKAKKKSYVVCVDDVPLQKSFASESAKTIRMLHKDEALECLEGPKDEKYAPVTRVKCRASGDGLLGWLTVEGGGITSWTGAYEVLCDTPLRETRDSESAEVRQLIVAEGLDLLEGPMEVDGMMRMKCRAKNDGATGWVTFIDADGNKTVESA